MQIIDRVARRNGYMRHSTLVPWLQKGQLNTVSSLSIRFLGAGFALDFLFPIASLKARRPSSPNKNYIHMIESSIYITVTVMEPLNKIKN